MNKKRPVLLTILDGWGISKDLNGNAVHNADMKFVNEMLDMYPNVQAHASGEWVGLPKGQMGNSEVGHIHIGSGRISFESLAKLNNEVDNNNFINNSEIKSTLEFVKNNNSNLHLLGLFSNGGVHAHLEHMISIYKTAVDFGITKIKFDLITDGRDTAPKLFDKFLKDLLDLIKENNNIGEISSISGRFYSMDRDRKNERVLEGYNAIVTKTSKNSFTNPMEYVLNQYSIGKDDEMIEPAFNSSSDSKIKENDAIIFTNFRPDRAIQLASVITNKGYEAWNTEEYKNVEFLGDKIRFLGLMKYSDTVKGHIAYPPNLIDNTLGKYLSDLKVPQLRIAETEKIAHITFFFDGGKDFFKNGLAKPEEILLPFASIDLISSPKVKTYDLKPEMAAKEITDKLLEEIKTEQFDFIVLNFANCDMVGHTGNYEATLKAVKFLDEQLKRIHDSFVLEHNGIMVITADHGNAEVMIDENNGPNKKHTTSFVPIIITDKNIKLDDKDPAIAKIAPTILDLLDLPIPSEMTQPSMIKK